MSYDLSIDEQDESPGAEDRLLGTRNCNPSEIGLIALLREDLATHEGDWMAQGFWAIAVHRFGNWRMGIRSRLLRAPFSLVYRFLNKWVEWTCGISLIYTVKVGRRVRIWHHGGMILARCALVTMCISDRTPRSALPAAAMTAG